MGLYDYVKIECEVDGFTSDELDDDWQTKDTPVQYMIHYRIGADGRLYEPQMEYYIVPEDERPSCKGKRPEDRTEIDKFCGMLGSRCVEERDTNWHGLINLSGSDLRLTAQFANGILIALERIKK